MSMLHELIAEKLPGQRFGVFFNSGEGTFFPDGSEDSSGFVVAEDGSHWFYWTGWDGERVVFEEWQHEQPQAEWADSHEYRDALTTSQRGQSQEGAG